MSLISLEESVGSAGCPLIPRVNGKAAVLECQFTQTKQTEKHKATADHNIIAPFCDFWCPVIPGLIGSRWHVSS